MAGIMNHCRSTQPTSRPSPIRLKYFFVILQLDAEVCVALETVDYGWTHSSIICVGHSRYIASSERAENISHSKADSFAGK